MITEDIKNIGDLDEWIQQPNVATETVVEKYTELREVLDGLIGSYPPQKQMVQMQFYFGHHSRTHKESGVKEEIPGWAWVYDLSEMDEEKLVCLFAVGDDNVVTELFILDPENLTIDHNTSRSGLN